MAPSPTAARIDAFPDPQHGPVADLFAYPPGRPSVRPVPTDLLLGIASGLAVVEELWRPHAHHGPDRRPVRLVATEAYEAWVIGWTTDQQVTPHDHGSSAGALAVVEGELEEVTTGPQGGRRRLGPGSVHPLAIGLVHDIVAPGPAPATSIHVYSPPLRTMGYYDGAGRLARTELVADEPAVVDARVAARALHPAALPAGPAARSRPSHLEVVP